MPFGAHLPSAGGTNGAVTSLAWTGWIIRSSRIPDRRLDRTWRADSACLPIRDTYRYGGFYSSATITSPYDFTIRTTGKGSYAKTGRISGEGKVSVQRSQRHHPALPPPPLYRHPLKPDGSKEKANGPRYLGSRRYGWHHPGHPW